MPFWTLRRAFGAAAVLALSLAVGWAAVVLAVAVTAARDQATTADAIVVLGSDGFHMLRLQIIASRLGLVPFTSPTPNSPIHANPRLNAGYLLAEGVKVPLTWLFQH